MRHITKADVCDFTNFTFFNHLWNRNVKVNISFSIFCFPLLSV